MVSSRLRGAGSAQKGSLSPDSGPPARKSALHVNMPYMDTKGPCDVSDMSVTAYLLDFLVQPC